MGVLGFYVRFAFWVLAGCAWVVLVALWLLVRVTTWLALRVSRRREPASVPDLREWLTPADRYWLGAHERLTRRP